ncbi:hypothetical protein EJ05DRAFT_473490 [Pseudovirgaria hyperparasitica]|uniref:Secreted protein n=1 Tax=Pseudovirgaria hyperparasitica TaxID=470096 RepID=A0A6A6WDJ2_9PEZI|nr:uncharacterized protein EJ05DRAFT_473490 [Pseudovirgaria hyperparasitica]KAF2760902.1 hypothetical protein EJ05DRAFT_473490 [Pseudovirgaria hyperparasitica]
MQLLTLFPLICARRHTLSSCAPRPYPNLTTYLGNLGHVSKALAWMQFQLPFKRQATSGPNLDTSQRSTTVVIHACIQT